MTAPFELRNISEKKFPFFEKGRRKKGRGGGGGGGVGEVGGHLMEWP